ncbi:72 kDa type IV collagenase-like [Monomorium pharaonis]|uniref:72 kDa type IV collagenase-like n=1 Tax=Monomorium pharaonis TaxID=307658 RepID=UPI0017464FCC|nr:72 kDa type IV collagenase-like [Monomorium pharaonis]
MRVAHLVIAISVVCALANENEQIVRENTEFAINYLQKYGYLAEEMQSFETICEQRILQDSISLFQEYYKLPITGEVSNETLDQMRRPRCGQPDIVQQNANAIGNKWPQRVLTWNFHLATKPMLEARAAFTLWQAASSLTFRRNISNPNILISWRDGNHMMLDRRNGNLCPSPLDGRGGVLAHATYPTGHAGYISEIHVDSKEHWYIYLDQTPSNSDSLLYVLTHEIGHSLGLQHDPHTDSIMYAYTTHYSHPIKLSDEDILNIQNLYGNSTAEKSPNRPISPPKPSIPTPKDIPSDLCEINRIDAILLLKKRMYIASDKYVWLIRLNNKKYNQPLALSTYLKFLPPNHTRVSASYQTPSGDIILFADNTIYKVNYPSFSLNADWPKTFSQFGLPADATINAAINTNRGRSYVIYDGYMIGEVDDYNGNIVKYHTIQTVFPGIPPNITLAFRYLDGNLYFVSQQQQIYKFNEFTENVLSASEFDVQALGIDCPRYGLLQQLRDLLHRFTRNTETLTRERNNNLF